MADDTLGVGAVDRSSGIARPPVRLVECHGGKKSNLLENTSDFGSVEKFESAAPSRWGAQGVEEHIFAVDSVELAEDIGEL